MIISLKIILKTIGVIAFTAIILLPTGVTYAAAAFNTSSSDFATFRTMNANQDAGTTNWSTAVSASAGQTVSFSIFFHNTSGEIARNTKVRSLLPSSSFSTAIITGQVWATNALQASNAVTVNLSSNQALNFVQGSVKYYTGRLATPTAIPGGQTGNEVITSSGLNIGDIALDGSGFVIFQAIVSQTQQIPQGQVPTVLTGSATNVTQNSATLSGTANPNGALSDAWFEYGTNSSLGSSGNITPVQSIGSTSGIQNMSATVSNLQPNTIYYYRAVSRNAIGTTTGSTLTFMTGQSQQGQQQNITPAVTTGSATNISQNSATLSGTANPNGSLTNAWFEYGTNSSLGNTATVTTIQSIGSTSGNQNMTGSALNLQANTIYYYRIVAQNSVGTSYGITLNFITGQQQQQQQQQNQSPSVWTGSTTNVSQNSATLTGTANPNGSLTNAWFEYGPTNSLGFVTTNQSIGSTFGNQNVSATISNLQPSTTYYYRLTASNSGGTSSDGILSFMTGQTQQQGQQGAPIVTTNYITNVGTNYATLNGSVNPNNNLTDVWFEYGTTYSLGSTIGFQSAAAGNYTQNVTAYLSGLQPSTTYYYRVVGRNNFGTLYGNTLSFTTQSAVSAPSTQTQGVPFVVTVPATFIYQNSALLNGTANPRGSVTSAWFEWGLTNSLGSTVSSQNMGQGTAGLLYSFALTGLQANTTYYYRAAAQNSFGTAYGNIENFTTAATGVQTTTPGVYIQTSAATSTVTLMPAIDNINPSAGESATFTVTYRNTGRSSVTNSILTIVLPEEVEYEISNPEPSSTDGNTLTFNLGTISPQGEGSISVKSKIKNFTKADSALVFNSTLNYTDSANKSNIVNAYLTVTVKQGVSVAASLINTIGTLFNNWVFDILLGLIIGFGIYHFFIRSKETDLAS